MAVVTTVYEPILTPDTICGRFLGYGKEYLTISRHNKFDFYALGSKKLEYATSIYPSVCTNDGFTVSAHALVTSGTSACIIFTVTVPKTGKVVYSLEDLQPKRLTNPAHKGTCISTSFKMKDYFAIFYDKKLHIYKLGKFIY